MRSRIAMPMFRLSPTPRSHGWAPVLAMTLCLWVSAATAQNNLGEVLDAGAKLLSPEEFKELIVQYVLTGPTPIGGNLEVMYASNGLMQGQGLPPVSAVTLAGQSMRIGGRWTIDAQSRICTTMTFSQMAGGAQGATMLPPRCQYWYKLDQRYFLSDSDTDRSAKVLARTIKR